MEWSCYLPILLAVVLFLLVGTIVERRIQGAVRRVLVPPRVHIPADQADQASPPTDKSADQQEQTNQQHTNQQEPTRHQQTDQRQTTNQLLNTSSHQQTNQQVTTSQQHKQQEPTSQRQTITKTDNTGASQSDSNLSKGDLVCKIKTRLQSIDPAKAKELGGVFLFNIMKGTSVYSWTLDLNQVIVYEGEPDEDPDTTFTLSEHHFKQLVTGREDARVIMQAGRCSVTGDVMRAMKLEPYIKLD